MSAWHFFLVQQSQTDGNALVCFFIGLSFADSISTSQFIVGSIPVHGLAPAVLGSQRVIGSVHPLEEKTAACVRESTILKEI